MHRRHHAVTLMQAAQGSPTLARLTELAKESGDRLKVVLPLIPVMLRPAVKPGPIDGDQWCLLVSSTAAAAKLRQMIPALQASLRSHGYQVNAIRLKIQPAQNP